LRTIIPIVRNKRAVGVDDYLLNKLSSFISKDKLLYQNNKTNTNKAIRIFFSMCNSKDSKELHSQLISFFLKDKLKQQICEMNLEESFNLIHYDIKDLEKLCSENENKLEMSSSSISVFSNIQDSKENKIIFYKSTQDSNSESSIENNRKWLIDYSYKTLNILNII
jgi:hypothetical protein